MVPEEQEPLLTKEIRPIPHDRLNLVYAIFYLLGIGTLLPWNFFSNANKYFSYKFRNVSATNESNFDNPEYSTHLQLMFENYLTVAAMVPNILFMFLNTAVTKMISLRFRIIVAAIIMIAMFLLAIAFASINTDAWQYTFFTVTVVSIVIMNAGSAVLQGGIFGLSGLFPRQYTQAVMGGMGMGGTIAAVANIIVLAIGADPSNNGFWYFIIAELFLVFALVGFIALPYLRYARYHSDPDESFSSRDRSYSVNSSSALTTSERLSSSEGSSEFSSSHEPMPQIVTHHNKDDVKSSLYLVFKKIWVYALSVFLVFFITLSCYPGINSSIHSMGKKDSVWSTTYFTAVTCFLAFNIFDLLGRSVAGPIQWPSDGSPLIPFFSVLRVVFVPLFLMCNIQPHNKLIPSIFHQDWIPGVLMVIFAFSNGYLGTLCMMYGPRKVSQEDIETAGSMMSFFLSTGLGIGALVSLILMQIVHNI